MQKILLVSGDENTAKICVGFLRLSGFTSVGLYDMDISELEKELTDTDIAVVDEDRSFFLDIIKKREIPVIMICDRHGCEFCDPVLTKPFSMAVLLENIHYILSKKNARQNAPAVQSGIVIDRDAQTVMLDGKILSVTSKEFEILVCMMEDPETVFTRERLIEAVWGNTFDGELRTVDSHMARLRTKLKDWGDKHIKTVYGKGYIFSN